MSGLVTLGIVKADSSFVVTVTRHEVLVSAIMTKAFLSGRTEVMDRMAADAGRWNNQPTADGYVLIDVNAGSIFDWHKGYPLNLIDQEYIGFGKSGDPASAVRREQLRPFIVAATYMHRQSLDLIEHRFAPFSTDRELRKAMETIAYEGLGRNLFYRPSFVNLVSYEVQTPAWEFVRLDYNHPDGLSALRERVQERSVLSEQDEQAWDAMYEKLTRLSPLDEAWEAMEKLVPVYKGSGMTP